LVNGPDRNRNIGLVIDFGKSVTARRKYGNYSATPIGAFGGRPWKVRILEGQDERVEKIVGLFVES